LRYILEFCSSSQQAISALKRIPINMPYNITVVDRQGDAKTIIICPGQAVKVISAAFATNHQQGGIIEDLDAIADSYAREQYLSTHLSDPRQADAPLVNLFLKAPLLRKQSDWHGWGTLYTARYQPLLGIVELHWPNGQILSQSFDLFIENDINVVSPAYL